MSSSQDLATGLAATAAPVYTDSSCTLMQSSSLNSTGNTYVAGGGSGQWTYTFTSATASVVITPH